eukprot:s268_g12.t1
MAELNEEIKDLEKSAAYNILDELYRTPRGLHGEP